MARVFTDNGAQQLLTAAQTRLQNNNYSIAFWMKRTATPAANCDIMGTAGGTSDGWYLLLTTGNLIQAAFVNGTLDAIRASSTAPALNTWVHVVVTHLMSGTGTANTDFGFYFDGKSEAGTSVQVGSGTTHANGAQALNVGAVTNVSNRAPPLNLGQVAFWDRIITPAEALALAGGAHPIRFREGLIEVLDMHTAHGEEGRIASLYLAQGATNPTSAAVNPPVETIPFLTMAA